MTRPAVPLALLLALAGCAGLGYQVNDSYLHTRALAESSNPDAQLALARMNADPASWPQMQGKAANPVEAAKWCTVVDDTPAPRPDPALQARGPSCQQIMASLPPDAIAKGSGEALT